MRYQITSCFKPHITLMVNGMSIIFCAYTWSPMALRTCDLVVHSFTILSYHDLSSIGGLTLKDARTKEFKETKKLQFMNRHLSSHDLRRNLKSIFKVYSMHYYYNRTKFTILSQNSSLVVKVPLHYLYKLTLHDFQWIFSQVLQNTKVK